MVIEKHSEETVKSVKSILERHSGNIPVLIYVRTNGKSKRFIIDYKIKISEKFLGEVQNLLGEESLAYQTM
jgi:hypothetical protein